MTPANFFSNGREGDLAVKVWDITQKLKPEGYSMNGIHDFFAKLPWTNRRIILARDWITNNREADGEGGIKSLNRALGGTNYSADEIANVEHFYVAALMGTLFPNNPFWLGWMS